MTPRPLLIVDDSESVLAFERAALSPHHECRLARNGAEALERMRAERPAAVVLDLSMPVMSGDEVLRRLRADEQLSDIPVVVVSSETHRQEWCLAHGARAFLGKPVSAQALVATVERVLMEDTRRNTGLAILGVRAGGVELALPLNTIVRVLPSLATMALPWGPQYLRESVAYEDRAVVVLDLARRFGLEPRRALEDRLIVVTSTPGGRLALRVDEVDAPEELGVGELQPASDSVADNDERLGRGLIGFAVIAGRSRPVVTPDGLLSAALSARVRAATGLES
jgi:CheY-like chemotaxis protein